MTVHASTDWVVEHACTRKAGLPMAEARRRASVQRSAGENVSAYRCPFCHRWHVGHVPNMESLENIARAIRDRAGNAPGPVAEVVE